MRGHHAFEACVEQLATAIRLGVYPFGSALPPERELAERLEVSRATLREAMAASRQLTERSRATLETAHRAVSGATSRARHRQADSRFHLTIASLSGSPRVVESVTSVQASLHEMLSAIPVLETNISHSDTQHAALVRAVLEGRPDRARQTMEEHCDDTAALLRGLLG